MNTHKSKSPDPSQEQIADACAQIRREWSGKEFDRRDYSARETDPYATPELPGDRDTPGRSN